MDGTTVAYGEIMMADLIYSIVGDDKCQKFKIIKSRDPEFKYGDMFPLAALDEFLIK